MSSSGLNLTVYQSCLGHNTTCTARQPGQVDPMNLVYAAGVFGIGALVFMILCCGIVSCNTKDSLSKGQNRM